MPTTPITVAGWNISDGATVPHTSDLVVKGTVNPSDKVDDIQVWMTYTDMGLVMHRAPDSLTKHLPTPVGGYHWEATWVSMTLGTIAGKTTFITVLALPNDPSSDYGGGSGTRKCIIEAKK